MQNTQNFNSTEQIAHFLYICCLVTHCQDCYNFYNFICKVPQYLTNLICCQTKTLHTVLVEAKYTVSQHHCIK